MLLCDRTGIPRKGLQPDGPQLFAALSVLAADSITISHELLGAVVSSHSRQTCVIAPVAKMQRMQNRNAKALFISRGARVDFYDIAIEICKLLHGRTVDGEVLLYQQLLEAPLDKLEQRGVPVKRLLGLRFTQHYEKVNDASQGSGSDAKGSAYHPLSQAHALERQIQSEETADFDASWRSQVRSATKLKFGRAFTGTQWSNPAHIDEHVDAVEFQCVHWSPANMKRFSIVQNIPLFVDASAAELWSSTADGSEAAERLACLLSALAKRVLVVAPSCIHMYFDKAGPNIAFNSSGTLFFNLRYYIQCHFKRSGNLSDPERDPQHIFFWFITMVHELAHNGALNHNSTHENFMETMATESFPRLLAFVQSLNSL